MSAIYVKSNFGVTTCFPLNLEDVSLCLMHLPLDLSGKAGPASNNVTAGLGLREYFQ
jgi:hypothetical protein